MIATDDDIAFLDEDAAAEPAETTAPWKILVVDDEDEVHRVTRLVKGGGNGKPAIASDFPAFK